MIEMIIERLNNLDMDVKKIMINGFKFSFVICLLSVLVLLTYKIKMIPILYDSGTLLFTCSLTFFADFLIMGVGFDTLKKEIEI